jgi:hypothetical protein
LPILSKLPENLNAEIMTACTGRVTYVASLLTPCMGQFRHVTSSDHNGSFQQNWSFEMAVHAVCSRKSPHILFQLLFISIFAVCVTFAHAGDVGLAWNANTDPGLAGYVVYYGDLAIPC